MSIAAEICVYTNTNVVIESLESVRQYLRKGTRRSRTFEFFEAAA